MKHARDTVNILPIDAGVIRNFMGQGANSVMNVKKMKIAVYKVNVLIYMVPPCQNVSATVISVGSDPIARKVSSFFFFF